MLFISFWKFIFITLKKHYLNNPWLLQRIASVLWSMALFYKCCSNSCLIYYLHPFVYQIFVIIISSSFPDKHIRLTDLLKHGRALLNSWLLICHFPLFWYQIARYYSLYYQFTLIQASSFLSIKKICSIGSSLIFPIMTTNARKKPKKFIYRLVLNSSFPTVLLTNEPCL